jgi:hypothetical protein
MGEEGEFGKCGHRAERDEGGVRMGFLAMVIPSPVSSTGSNYLLIYSSSKLLGEVNNFSTWLCLLVEF